MSYINDTVQNTLIILRSKDIMIIIIIIFYFMRVNSLIFSETLRLHNRGYDIHAQYKI